MSAQVGKAAIVLEVDRSKVQGDLDAAKSQVEGFASTLKNVLISYLSINAVKSFMDGMLGIADSVAEAVDSLGDFSEISGIAINKVRQLQYAVQANGQDWEQVQTSIVRFNRAIGEAALSGGSTGKMFDALGVKIKDSSGALKPTEELLLSVADKFATLTDKQVKCAIAQELFGRSTKEIIPILNLGAEGIRRYMSEAESLGIKITEENQAAVADYFRTKTQFEAIIGSIKMELGTALMPILGQLAQQLRGALLGPNGELKSEVKSAINSAVGAFREFASTIIQNAPAIIKSIGTILKVIEGVATGIGMVIDGWGKLYNLINDPTGRKHLEEVAAGFSGATPYAQGRAAQWRMYRRGLGPMPTTVAKPGESKPPEGGGGLNLDSLIGGMGKNATQAAAAAVDLSAKWADATNVMSMGLSQVNEIIISIMQQIEEGKQSAARQGLMEAVQGAIIGQSIDWTSLESMPGRGGMPDLMQFSPMAQGQEGFSLFDAGALTQFNDAYATFIDLWATMPLGSVFDQLQTAWAGFDMEGYNGTLEQILMTTDTFASRFAEAAETIGATVGALASEGLMGGWQQMLGKLVAMLAQYFGKKLITMGTAMVAEGAAEVVMGMNPLTPNPLLVAHGSSMMKTGGVLIGVGGALSAASGAIGSAVAGALGGGSQSTSSAMTSGAAANTAPESITYTMGQGQSSAGGGGTTNITIHAVDAASFADLVRRHGEGPIMDVVESNYRGNGSARAMQRWS